MSRTEPWCPTCVRPLSCRVHEAVAIWSCATCTGSFLQAEQVRAIAATETSPRSAAERAAEQAASRAGPAPGEVTAAPTRCPWCGQVMGRSRYEGSSAILVDTCAQGCGVWLDRGELERIEAWSEAERARLIAPP